MAKPKNMTPEQETAWREADALKRRIRYANSTEYRSKRLKQNSSFFKNSSDARAKKVSYEAERLKSNVRARQKKNEQELRRRERRPEIKITKREQERKKRQTDPSYNEKILEKNKFWRAKKRLAAEHDAFMKMLAEEESAALAAAHE